VDEVLSIECETPSLKIVIEFLPDTVELERHLVHLEHLNEKYRDETKMNEAHKNHVKSQYDKSACPRIFYKEYIVLVYE